MKHGYQHELNRAVAKATGETVTTIRHRGFSLLTRIISDSNPNPENDDNRSALRQRVTDGVSGRGARPRSPSAASNAETPLPAVSAMEICK